MLAVRLFRYFLFKIDRKPPSYFTQCPAKVK